MTPGEYEAARWVNFFQKHLHHTKGRFKGQPFNLIPYQRVITEELFGSLTVAEKRQYRTAYVEVPKKNGKSEYAAGVALGGLIVDDEPGAEVYLAAATRDQASIIFKIAESMVYQDEMLGDLLRVIPSTKTIVHREYPDRFLRALSADAGGTDGINPHIVIFDELHRQKNSDLWDVLEYGSDVREQPLLFAITTAGVRGESPVCWEQHEYARQIIEGVIKDPSYYAVIYKLEDDEDWTVEGEPGDPETGEGRTGWYKCNPALGYFMNVETVRDSVQKALDAPSKQNRLRRFRFNQWTNAETRFFNMDRWKDCGTPFNPHDLLGKPCWAGLDLSSTTDVTAFSMVFKIERGVYRLLTRYWLPEEELMERVRRDKVPYDIWAKQGLITLTPGEVVDYGRVRKDINDMGDLYKIREIAHDPWNALQLATELGEEDGFKMIAVRQGMASMSAPTKALEAGILNQTIQHGGDPVLTWMADCTSVRYDNKDNIMPIKPDRKKSGKRIDGIVSTILALSRVIVQPEYRESVYRHRGIIVLGGSE